MTNPKRQILLSSLVMILAVLNLLAANVDHAASQSGTEIHTTPNPLTMDTCEEVELAIRVENVENLTGYHLDITYDPAVVEILEVRNGGFLDSGIYEVTNGVDLNTGAISFGMVQQNSPDQPLTPKSGSGDLIVIRMRALVAGGSSDFVIDPSSLLVNWPDVMPIPHDTYNGVVNTQAYTNVVQNWYLAEGFTGDNASTFILIQNPGLNPADICVTYMLQTGGIKYRKVQVASQSRYTIAAQDPDQVGSGVAFSTKLSSSQNIIVERSMYWPNGEGTQGGHVTTGVTDPAIEWYLAEGFTGANFMTFILIQNPNNDPADIEVTYMPDTAGNIVKNFTVAGNSRYTIVAHDPNPDGPGIGVDMAFATRVVSTNGQPIIVERAMYFANEGHEAMGVKAPNTNWYLAEGYTDLGFGTFILLQNPNSETAVVQVTYMLAGGGTVNKEVSVNPNSRFTIVGSEDFLYGVGPAQTFSTKLVSTVPIIVERAMYWPTSDTGQAGHDSPGVTAPANNWNLAEGYTGAGFDTRILIQNPNDLPANVTLTYMLQGGGTVTKQVMVLAKSRFTVIGAEGDLFGVGADLAFATRITSDQPIIVERAMYYPGGGHGTTGVAE